MTADMLTVLVPLPEDASIGDPLHLSADGVLLARSYYGSTGWAVVYVDAEHAGQRVTAHLMKRRLVEFTLPDHDCVLHGQRPEPLTESQTESLRIREMSAADRERHELQLVLAPHVDQVGVGWSPLDLDVSLPELRAHAELVGVTIPALLTITLGDATTEPTASAKWAIRPQPPQIDTYAEGYGVDPADRLITTDVIIDTLNALGVSTIALTPTDQTLAGPNGQGMLYHFTHGPQAELQDEPFIRFAMPNTPARLEDLVPPQAANEGGLIPILHGQVRPSDLLLALGEMFLPGLILSRRSGQDVFDVQPISSLTDVRPTAIVLPADDPPLVAGDAIRVTSGNRFERFRPREYYWDPELYWLDSYDMIGPDAPNFIVRPNAPAGTLAIEPTTLGTIETSSINLPMWPPPGVLGIVIYIKNTRVDYNITDVMYLEWKQVFTGGDLTYLNALTFDIDAPQYRAWVVSSDSLVSALADADQFNEQFPGGPAWAIRFYSRWAGDDFPLAPQMRVCPILDATPT